MRDDQNAVALMRIIIDIDDTLTVTARIEGVDKPTTDQAAALRYLAQLADAHRYNLESPHA